MNNQNKPDNLNKSTVQNVNTEQPNNVANQSNILKDLKNLWDSLHGYSAKTAKLEKYYEDIKDENTVLRKQINSCFTRINSLEKENDQLKELQESVRTLDAKVRTSEKDKTKTETSYIRDISF